MLDPDRYDDVAAAFDRYAEQTVFPITECLMEMTGVGEGQAVLDVACGSGIVARRAAGIVGASGRVTGIDLSPGQISVARERSRALGYRWNDFQVMDALHLEFPDASFDVVVAQFPHLPDRARCIAEMFRVLKLGGAFAIGNGGGKAPLWPLRNAPEQSDLAPEARVEALFQRCLEDHFPVLIESDAGSAPAPREALRDELLAAGFERIKLWSYAYAAPFTSVEETFELQCVRNSRYRMALNGLDQAAVSAFEDDYRSRAKPTFDRFGYATVTSGALFGTGVRPILEE